MFDPAPIHRDMAAIFASASRHADAWPAAKGRMVEQAGLPSPRRPRSWRLRLILLPMLVAAMLIGFLGGSALDRGGIGRSIRSALSPTGAPEQPRTPPRAMVALAIDPPPARPIVAEPAGQPDAERDRPQIKASAGHRSWRWRRPRWYRSRAHAPATPLADQMLQRALDEDAAVTRRLNTQALTHDAPRSPIRDTR